MYARNYGVGQLEDSSSSLLIGFVALVVLFMVSGASRYRVRK